MSNWNDISFTPKGWQCPVCGAVYSPTTPMCYNCTGKTYTFSTTTGELDIDFYKKYLNHSDNTEYKPMGDNRE